MTVSNGPWSGWTYARQCAGCTTSTVAVHYRWLINSGPVELCSSCTADWLLNVLLDDGDARIEAL